MFFKNGLGCGWLGFFMCLASLRARATCDVLLGLLVFWAIEGGLAF